MTKEPTVRIGIDIPFSTVAKLEEYAKSLSIKRSQAIRAILVQYLSQKGE